VSTPASSVPTAWAIASVLVRIGVLGTGMVGTTLASDVNVKVVR
jgi:hypothetical protein